MLITATLYLSPKPLLLEGINFSTAVYGDQQQLLRLTLSKDEKYRLYTPLSKISPQFKEAALLQEDQYFYWHFGLNPLAMLKAGWQTYLVKSRRIGASTITMQLARIRYGINSKKFAGKIEQIVRALQLEMHYSKEQLLEAYLNLAPFSANIEGVGAASLIYFAKPIDKISLPEALTLAVIPQNPRQRTPLNKDLKQIRNKLFARWLLQHPEDKNLSASINLPLQMRTRGDLPFIAPHFVNALLMENKGEINSSLDLRLQSIIKKISTNYLERKKAIGVYNAAVLLVDSRDMSIKAAMGSADFFNQRISGQIDGTDIKRSPGSTLKPFIYGLALDQGLIHPNTVLKDVPTSFGSYNPENFDYDFMGPIKAKDALVLSRNIPAIYLSSQLNKPNLHQLLEKAEIKNLKPESYYGLALNLGAAELTMKELTALYAILANDGFWYPLRSRKDEPTSKEKRLLSREASFLILDMLKATPRPEANTSETAVSWKTGTSSGYHDAWSIGLFGPYVLTVWLGNFDNKANPAFVGKNLAAPLFFELIDAIRHERAPLPLLDKRPETMNLSKIEVCKASGLLPTRYCKDKELTWFIPGVSPIKSDTIYREVAIDRKTGLRTCHINENTSFEVYEFWPTDLLSIFKKAGIQRRIPPPFEPDCRIRDNTKGLSPQIRSPQTDLNYILSANSKQIMQIPLTAVTDADVRVIYWFINESYLVETSPDQPFLWQAKPGSFVIRVVDDQGRADAREIKIRVES